MNDDWGDYDFETYVELSPGANTKHIATELSAIQNNHNHFAKVQFLLQPLSDIHFNTIQNPEKKKLVNIFFVIAIIILLVGCINYVNLSTARASTRSKEISIKKIIGAGKRKLFIQFFTEITLVFSIAALLSFILLGALKPLFTSISGKQHFITFNNPTVFLTILITLAITLILTAVYPSLQLASQPMHLLKGLTGGIQKGKVRRALVIIQFFFAIVFVLLTLVIGKQMQYIRNKDIGYDKSCVFRFQAGNAREHYNSFRQQLLAHSVIKQVAGSRGDIIGLGGATSDTDWEGKEKGKEFIINQIGIDEHLVPLLKLQLADGNNFTGIGDSLQYLMNEAAVRETGLKDPVGKTFSLHESKGVIKGIIKDFNFTTLKEKIEPCIFYYEPYAFTIYVKCDRADIPLAIGKAEAIWKLYNPGFPFDYRFIDDDFEKIYSADGRTYLLFTFFSSIALFISGLGLLGLVTFTVQQKTKEIGIRKVLGASTTKIMLSLSRDYIIMICIAFLTGAAFAGWLGKKWLEGFAYRTHLEFSLFFITGFIIAALVALILTAQGLSITLTKPIKSLRTE